MCSLLLPQHLQCCGASHPALEHCIGENNSEGKKGCSSKGCPLHGTGLFLPWVLQIPCVSLGCRITGICFWTWSPPSHLWQDWHQCSGQLGLCLEMPENLQRVEITWPLWAAQCTALRVNQVSPPAWPGAPGLEFVAIAPAQSPAATRRCLAPSL